MRVEAFLDALAHGRGFAGIGDAVEGVAPHHQHLEEDDGQAEGVVLLGAHHAVKGLALQFGWGVVRYTHGAQELLSAVAELEAVGIHQGDGGVVCHQHAGGVDVADDAAGVVDGGDSTRNVGGGARQKAIVDVRKVLLARTGGVQVVQGATVAHGFHQEAGKGAVLGVHHVHGKGRKGRLSGQAGIHHGSNLVGQLGLVGRLVELHRMVAPVGGNVDAAFAAAAQPFTQLQSTPTAQAQFQSVGRVFLVIGTGGHGRWGVSGMGGVLRRARPSGKDSGPGAVGKAVSWWRQSDSLAYVLDGVDGGECSTAMTSVLSSSVRLLTASLSR